MKRFFAIVLCLLMVTALFACKAEPQKPEDKPAETETKGLDIKVGFICLHDENSTYDLNFINAAKAACAKDSVLNQLTMKIIPCYFLI